MLFNISKCEVTRVTKRNPVKATYKIHVYDLSITKTGKMPGGHHIRGPHMEVTSGCNYKEGKQQSGLPLQEPYYLPSDTQPCTDPSLSMPHQHGIRTQQHISSSWKGYNAG